ncbi:uncharacterized protein BJ171DRAFT_295463 [Polychytrium aggregatum]|uniref:uncharacterized protein n=1 Tax=Polychytrium aggregatum TaxID=110093 RepID=UPI0022FEB8F2|nr:uncharacterized protein BJ171DRAFT_295463 [Polychytrium aggregatum]KAI9207323.1 hypothetical protein BJ171DRAFT_295463 [Polychytrium aggregatum]
MLSVGWDVECDARTISGQVRTALRLLPSPRTNKEIARHAATCRCIVLVGAGSVGDMALRIASCQPSQPSQPARPAKGRKMRCMWDQQQQPTNAVGGRGRSRDQSRCCCWHRDSRRNSSGSIGRHRRAGFLAHFADHSAAHLVVLSLGLHGDCRVVCGWQLWGLSRLGSRSARSSILAGAMPGLESRGWEVWRSQSRYPRKRREACSRSGTYSAISYLVRLRYRIDGRGCSNYLMQRRSCRSAMIRCPATMADRQGLPRTDPLIVILNSDPRKYWSSTPCDAYPIHLPPHRLLSAPTGC